MLTLTLIKIFNYRKLGPAEYHSSVGENLVASEMMVLTTEEYMIPPNYVLRQQATIFNDDDFKKRDRGGNKERH